MYIAFQLFEIDMVKHKNNKFVTRAVFYYYSVTNMALTLRLRDSEHLTLPLLWTYEAQYKKSYVTDRHDF